MVPWQVLAQQIEQALPVVGAECVAEAGKPIGVTMGQIKAETAKFVRRCLPLQMLHVRQEPQAFASVLAALNSSGMCRFIGLLAHLLYWEVFGYVHAPGTELPAKSLNSATVSVHDCWYRLTAPYRDRPSGVRLALPAFL